MRTRTKRVPRVLVAALFLVGILVAQFSMGMVAFAAAKTWDNGGGDGKFSTAANWNADTLPTNGDSLIFDVTGLSSDATLDNDISGLSVSGITFSGQNSSFDYIINGNVLTVQGTIAESTTDNHATNNFIPQINTGLSLSGDLILQSVVLHTGTVTTNGHAISLSSQTSAVCGITTISSPITGSGAIHVTGAGQILLNGTSPSFTGTVDIASGGTALVGAQAIQAATSLTSTSSALIIYLNSANRTIAPNLNLGGTLTLDPGFRNPCSGDSSDGLDLTVSGNLSLNANLVYKGLRFSTGTSDTTINGTYMANGHTLSTDGASQGTITVPPDSTPAAPTAPLNLAATPGSTQAALSWDVPTSSGTQAITDYQVQYKLSTDVSWTTFAHTASTATARTVTGLTNGQNYDFRVAAVNSVGTGPNVTIANIAVAATLTTPDVVTSLGATVDGTSHNLVLNWTAPASNGGSAITDYLVEIKLSSGSTWSTVSHVPFTGNSFEIFTGLTDGQTYDLRVSPINAQGTGPSALVSNYTYNSGTGNTGNVGNASGTGANETPGAPNTGLRLQVKSPFTIVILGFGSVVALLIAFWPRRSELNKRF